MIDALSKTGADAIKFQIANPKKFIVTMLLKQITKNKTINLKLY